VTAASFTKKVVNVEGAGAGSAAVLGISLADICSTLRL
jgi:hypothetical protein